MTVGEIPEALRANSAHPHGHRVATTRTLLHLKNWITTGLVVPVRFGPNPKSYRLHKIAQREMVNWPADRSTWLLNSFPTETRKFSWASKKTVTQMMRLHGTCRSSFKRAIHSLPWYRSMLSWIPKTFPRRKRLWMLGSSTIAS